MYLAVPEQLVCRPVLVLACALLLQDHLAPIGILQTIGRLVLQVVKFLDDVAALACRALLQHHTSVFVDLEPKQRWIVVVVLEDPISAIRVCIVGKLLEKTPVRGLKPVAPDRLAVNLQRLQDNCRLVVAEVVLQSVTRDLLPNQIL